MKNASIFHVIITDKQREQCIHELVKKGLEPTEGNIEDLIQQSVDAAIDNPSGNTQAGRSFVYTLAYPDSMGGRIFYVGQSCMETRPQDHAREAKNGGQSEKCKVIRSIWAQGEKVIVGRAHENLSSWDAIILEKELIYKIGYEHLTNVPPRTKDKTYKGTFPIRSI